MTRHQRRRAELQATDAAFAKQFGRAPRDFSILPAVFGADEIQIECLADAETTGTFSRSVHRQAKRLRGDE